MFLFDSFDELPDFIAATGAERLGEQHLEAIRRFVERLPTGSAVVAGRAFPAPDVSTAWPIVTLLPLSAANQRSVIRSPGLGRPAERNLRRQIATGPGIRALADSPLTLSLLCALATDPDGAPLPTTLPEILGRALQARLNAALCPSPGLMARAARAPRPCTRWPSRSLLA